MDVISCLPYTLLERPGSEGTSIYAPLKLLRLLRVGKLVRFSERFVNANGWRILRLLGMFVILAHWCGCAWHSVLDDNDENGNESWLDSISEERRSTPLSLYVTTLNAAFLMLYGENVGATTTKEEVVSMLLMLIGACIQATLFGQVALLISNSNSTIGKYQEKQEIMNENMDALHLPKSVKQRVQNYFDYNWKRQRALDRDEFMANLSPPLCAEVALSLHSNMIQKVAILKGFDEQFIVAIVQELTASIYLPGDFIILKGQIGIIKSIHCGISPSDLTPARCMHFFNPRTGNVLHSQWSVLGCERAREPGVRRAARR